MAGSKRCNKVWCFLYVMLLFVSGVLLIVCSIFLGNKLVYFFKLLPSESIAPFILILLLAVGHIVLTWLGIKGARSEYPFHILLFMAITFVFMLSEIAVATWAFVLRGKMNEKCIELMKSSFEEFVKSNFNHDKLDWVRLQTQFECCGISRVDDYTVLGSLPFSCCAATTSTCNRIYQDGCKDKLVQYVKQLLLYLGLAGFGSVLFQVLGLIAFTAYTKLLNNRLLRKHNEGLLFYKKLTL